MKILFFSLKMLPFHFLLLCDLLYLRVFCGCLLDTSSRRRVKYMRRGWRGNPSLELETFQLRKKDSEMQT